MDYEIRRYRPGDEHAILETFHLVFSRDDPSFRPRSLEDWRWQYLENPAGNRIVLGIDAEGRVIGHQSSVPVRVRVGPETVTWSQVVDSFSDPRRGRGLKKPGVFGTTARAHVDVFGGESPGRDPVMFGLPIRPAWRIGRLHLGYEACRAQDVLVLDDLGRAEEPSPGVEVEELERFPQDVAALTERAAGHRGALAVRDAAYLNWRYADHPTKRYRLALARRAGGGPEPVGLAVHRLGPLVGGEPVGLVCDWLVDPVDEGACRALRRWAVDRTRADGADRLVGAWPDTAPEWLAFQDAGFRVDPIPYFCVTNQHTPRFGMRWLYWNWYYTLGDFDLW